MTTQDRPILGPVDSAEGLLAAVKQLAEARPKSLLLFRGQNNLHPTVRSGLSRPDVRYEPDVDRGFSAIAGNLLGHQSLGPRNAAFRKAVLQHYGFPTHYVDLTSDALVAAWFATNKSEARSFIFGGVPFRYIDQKTYVARKEGTGYVVILAIPDPDSLKQERRLFDISTLTPFLRPRRQCAWLIYDRHPLLPDPNDFWIASIAVDCSKFSSTFSCTYLFPAPKEDTGFEALLNLPYVEVPDFWVQQRRKQRPGQEKQNQEKLDATEKSDRSEEPDKPERKFTMDFGMRALPLPEYSDPTSLKDEYNHKWNDSTLTEPTPMHEWVRWSFDLTGQFQGIAGNINLATKVTLSPRVKEILANAPDDIPLRWPNLGTDELFFTFAQFGHDKVYDIEYPYEGVWLHRDKDLVIEHPMSATEDSFDVHAGHIYEFIGDTLLRQKVRSCCECNSPETHDARVKSMLRLSALIELKHFYI